jgi:hypothetical protein
VRQGKSLLEKGLNALPNHQGLIKLQQDFPDTP